MTTKRSFIKTINAVFCSLKLVRTNKKFCDNNVNNLKLILIRDLTNFKAINIDQSLDGEISYNGSLFMSFPPMRENILTSFSRGSFRLIEDSGLISVEMKHEYSGAIALLVSFGICVSLLFLSLIKEVYIVFLIPAIITCINLSISKLYFVRYSKRLCDRLDNHGVDWTA